MKNTGFTLIELIVVIVILGIVSAIALPNMFSWVQRSRGAEALADLSNAKNIVEACVQAHQGTESSCSSLTFADSAKFTTTLQSDFSFNAFKAGEGIGCAGVCPSSIEDGSPHWNLLACKIFVSSNPFAVIPPATDCVALIRDNNPTSPVISCESFGAYKGIC